MLMTQTHSQTSIHVKLHSRRGYQAIAVGSIKRLAGAH